jgi:hypothetical protein
VDWIIAQHRPGWKPDVGKSNELATLIVVARDVARDVANHLCTGYRPWAVVPRTDGHSRQPRLEQGRYVAFMVDLETAKAEVRRAIGRIAELSE